MSASDDPDARPAMGDLLARHLPALERYVRRRTGAGLSARESASDIVQSICRDVLEDDGAFDYRGDAAFTAWLQQRAMHRILRKAEFHRAQRRDPAREVPGDAGEILGEAPLTGPATPSRAAAGREELARLEAGIARLPEVYREVLLMHRVEGLPHAEIARRLDRSEGAVRNLLYRGLARLGEILERGGG